MTNEKFDELWNEIIEPAIKEFIENSPPLICEKYKYYRDSIIPRMIWATENVSGPHENYTVSADSVTMRYVATNANMLANVFYFLELYSSSMQ